MAIAEAPLTDDPGTPHDFFEEIESLKLQVETLKTEIATIKGASIHALVSPPKRPCFREL